MFWSSAVKPVVYGDVIPVATKCIMCDTELPNFKFSLTQRRNKRRDDRTCKNCVIKQNKQHCNKDFVTEFSTSNSHSLLFDDPMNICYADHNQLSDKLCKGYVNIIQKLLTVVIPTDIYKVIRDYYNDKHDANFLFSGETDFWDMDYCEDFWGMDDYWRFWTVYGKILNWTSDKRKDTYYLDIEPKIHKNLCLPLNRIGIKFKLLNIYTWNAWTIYCGALSSLSLTNNHRFSSFNAGQLGIFQNYGRDLRKVIDVQQYDFITYIFDFNDGVLDIWLSQNYSKKDNKIYSIAIDIESEYKLQVSVYDRVDCFEYVNLLAICN